MDTSNTAIVIGTGFGGAVAACRLAQAGFTLTVLERGRRYEAGDMPPVPDGSHRLPEIGRWTWNGNNGLWDVVDLGEVISVQAAGYGGGSLVYGAVHLRPMPEVFDETWPSVYRSGALEEYYDLAGYMLDAAPITEHALQPQITKSDQFRKAAEFQQGSSEAFFYPPLAISSRTGLNVHGRSQKACIGCGACCTGCPETAKNSLDFNYLAIAERCGAQIKTQCEVTGITQRADGHWVVEYVDILSAQKLECCARNLFLCAGSVHSTRLLAKTKFTVVPPKLKSKIGVGYFPGGDAIALVYDTAHPQYPWFGPTITSCLVHHDPHDAKRYLLIQDGGYVPQLNGFAGLFQSPIWVGRNRLTNAGPAAITKSNEPDFQARKPSLIRGLPSGVDDVLDAMALGDFNAIVPQKLHERISNFLEELRQPLPLKAVVEQTVALTLRENQTRGWLTRTFPKVFSVDSWLMRKLRQFEQWLIFSVIGNSDDMARLAFKAMLMQLNPSRKAFAQTVLAASASAPERRAMLLCMGTDAAPGMLLYDSDNDRLVADLDLFHLAPGYALQEQLMTRLATALGGELRTNPAWSFLGKPITVHNQGGCPMSEDANYGVTTPDGQVHGCEGLYVLDGAILCHSVGVNPSATITAIAERNIYQFIKKTNPAWPACNADDGSINCRCGACNYRNQVSAARAWREKAEAAGWHLRPPKRPPTAEESSGFDHSNLPEPLGIKFTERMQGYFGKTEGEAVGAAEARPLAGYRRLETLGRPHNAIELKLTASSHNLAQFFEDQDHRMKLQGIVKLQLPGDEDARTFDVHGHAELFVPRYKPYEFAANARSPTERSALFQSREFDEDRLRAQKWFTGRDHVTKLNPDAGQRLLRYLLRFEKLPGWELNGYKVVSDNPSPAAWRDVSALYFNLLGPAESSSAARCKAAGVVHLDINEFLYNQIASLEVTGTEDSARIVWATAKFATFFFGTLLRIAVPQLPSAVATFFGTGRSWKDRDDSR